jgi:hypothetical protein
MPGWDMKGFQPKDLRPCGKGYKSSACFGIIYFHHNINKTPRLFEHCEEALRALTAQRYNQ